MSASVFHILHTNDLHSHLDQWPKIMTLLKEKKEQIEDKGENVLVFDIGDHIDRVHPLTEASLGKANVRLMNQVGYDAVTMGNNEGITIDKETLCQLYEEANFPILVANLFHQNGERPNWLKPYEIIHLTDQLTVGVIGLTIPFQPFYEILGWKAIDYTEILPILVKEVRQQADIVIFLSHLGLNFDEEVANQVHGIDIILGGHTHHVLDGGLKIKNTIIHQAGKFGNYVGQLSLVFDVDKKHLKEYRAKCIEVNSFPPCQKTVDMLTELSENLTAPLKEEIVTIKEPFPISWDKPSSFATLLAMAIKEWCGGEIGMVNSGILLEGLPAGTITRADLHRVCPHPINPCTVQLDGQELKEIIRHSLTNEMISRQVRGFGFRGKLMGIMVYDGVTYEMKKRSDGLQHISNIKINGKSIQVDRKYHVATIDMFTFGHLFPAIATAKVKKFYMPELLRDLLAWKLKKMKL